MTALILHGDARALPLPDASVDLIVTSPPYWALRAYEDDGEHYEGQIGSEPTPAEYLDNLWAVAAECARVLKPSGSMFWNLGDKFNSANNSRNGKGKTGLDPARRPKMYNGSRGDVSADIPEKCLIGLPWRFAIGCTDRLGLILRRDIIWSKKNCLSGGTQVYAKVKGRPTSIKVHDLCRAYAPEQVQLWNGQKWTQVLWWEPTGRNENAEESYKAIRVARSRGEEPVVGGDIEAAPANIDGRLTVAWSTPKI